MGEDWIAQILSDRWFPAAVAYFLGLITGWLIWSGGAAHAPEEDANGDLLENANVDTPVIEVKPPEDSSADQNSNGREAPVVSNAEISMKIGALEAELKATRDMLDDTDAETAAFSDLLMSLEEAVKRANGRLKLIIKAVKRAKIDD